HDVATATLLALGVALWLVLKVHKNTLSSPAELMVRYLRKVMLFCLFWLFGGGVVRILAFSRYELPEARAKDLLPGLLAKHVLAFVLVLAGGILWQRGIRRYRETIKKGS
ncbi:MAG: hypothetical protein D6778_03335, partial [Nitrospirae bacterium]